MKKFIHSKHIQNIHDIDDSSECFIIQTICSPGFERLTRKTIHSPSHSFRTYETSNIYEHENDELPQTTSSKFFSSEDINSSSNLVSFQNHYPYSPIPINEYVTSNSHSSTSQQYLSSTDEYSEPITYEIFIQQQQQQEQQQHENQMNYTYDYYNNEMPSSQYEFDDELIHSSTSSAYIPNSFPVQLPLPSPIHRNEKIKKKDSLINTSKITKAKEKKSSSDTKNQQNALPHVCNYPECKKNFRRLSDLRNHEKVHKLRPFKCTWEGCKWKYAQSDELERHIRRHKGLKPFLCNLCDRAYIRSDHLAGHMKIHL